VRAMTTEELYELLNQVPRHDVWANALAESDVDAVIGVLGSMGVNRPEFRAAAAAAVQEKLTERSIAATEKLERSATRVAWIGTILALIGVVLAALQVWLAIVSREGGGVR
jgi:hypothetical protein